MRILAGDESADFGCNSKVPFDINGSPPSSSSSTLSPFSPLLLIESLSRKSFSYGKLPLEPIKLMVLKLDGSSFDITVQKNPSVAQLMQGVEAAFSHLPKHGVGKVSWTHVWGQFCLCFEGQKLLHDQDSHVLYGIKDGDQLEFVRHRSISYNLVKERSEKQDRDMEESEASPTKKNDRKNESSSEQENLKKQNHDEDENETESCDDVGVNITCQCSWGLLLGRLFSSRKQKGQETSCQELLDGSKST